MKREVTAYLDRIGWSGELRQDLPTLAALVRAHRYAVPYETLDLWFRREFSLAIPAIYDKLVTRRRGGYCFELNGLFAWLLRELGFNVREYFGRWLLGEDEEVPMRRHRVICVALPGHPNQLVDVGIGLPFMFSPLDFAFAVPQNRDGRVYRVVRDPVQASIVEFQAPDGWKRLFSFDTTPQLEHDFDYAHWWCRTNPASSFLSRVWVYLPRPDGSAKALAFDDKDEFKGWRQLVYCSREANGENLKIPIGGPEHLCSILLEHFGIREDLQDILNPGNRVNIAVTS